MTEDCNCNGSELIRYLPSQMMTRRDAKALAARRFVDATPIPARIRLNINTDAKPPETGPFAKMNPELREALREFITEHLEEPDFMHRYNEFLTKLADDTDDRHFASFAEDLRRARPEIPSALLVDVKRSQYGDKR